MRQTVLAGRAQMIGRMTIGLLLAAAAGCGQPAKGKLTGRVLLDGKPVSGGILMFVPADFKGQSASANVNDAGGYEVELPAGEMLVSFDNRHLAPPAPRGRPPLPKGMSPDIVAKLGGGNAAPAAAATDPAQSGKYVKVPEKYYMAETSNLKVTVKSGDQKHDVELSSK
jgi:hypothetical protein